MVFHFIAGNSNFGAATDDHWYTFIWVKFKSHLSDHSVRLHVFKSCCKVNLSIGDFISRNNFVSSANRKTKLSLSTLLFKSNGIFFLRWQNMVFIFKVQTWHFVCGIRRSFAFTMENILSVWYTTTPGWTSKFGKVWKTRCQNAATRANIWRCFLVSLDDKYLWVMVSNNRHELYFYSKLLCFSSIHCFCGQIRYLNIRHERTLTSSPLMLKCSERCRETQEREPAHIGWCLVIQPQKFPRYFEIGS